MVFYYAGHGVQINSNQLLLPIDITAVNDAQVQRDAVPLVEVQDALKDARFALLVIDACRDNPFPKTAGRSIGGGTRGLMPPEPVTGQVIMMSAGRNQKALDNVPGESHANGLFTWELTKAINTPGIEIRVALETVKDRVDDKAKTIGHEQRPGMVSDLRGNFYFFGPTTVQVQGGTSTTDPETETWAAAQSVNSAAAYQTYLDSYPQGRFVSAAKIKLGAPAGQTFTAAPLKPTPAASTDPETQFWNEVKNSGAREYLDAYLKQYPKGKYTALARVEIRKLDDQETVTSVVPTVNGIEFVPVPAGTFTLGCGSWQSDCSSDEKPTVNVAIKAFDIGKYEVTQAQWKKLMGNSPSYFKSCGDQCPVEQVSWNDAQQFITKLNSPGGQCIYRLPTEAEWEYACRSGGKNEKYCGGSNVDQVAWYYSNSGSKTHSVGRKAANGLGIYDMSGNVWEWTCSWYTDSYWSGTNNHEKCTGNGSSRVGRGGGWSYGASGARSAGRYYGGPAFRYSVLGFRLARTCP